MKIKQLLVVSLAVLALAGCASSNSGSVYKRDETRQAQVVKTGVVESVRQVQIEGTEGTIGAVAGGVVGGVAGNAVGGGKGRNIATVIGAVAGALAGKALEEGVTKKDGLEITVQLDSGGLIAIVQEADEEFHPGDRVRLLESGGSTRVSH
jgi:outer membrane lipoprotein SlyB